VRTRTEVSGGEDLLRDLQRMGKRGAEIGIEVLEAKAKEIEARAKSIVPVDDVEGGDLRDSIRTTKPQKTRAGRISVAVVAGGPYLAKLASERGRKNPGAYGVIQHDDMTLNHDSGEAKFVEKPVLAITPTIPDALREAMDRG
jgi:hypothetical protein